MAVRDVTLHRSGEQVDRVRLRYRSRTVGCEPAVVGEGRHERLQLQLREPFGGAAPGQLAALMRGETIVGHGTIA